MGTKTLTPHLLHKMQAYWRAANDLWVGDGLLPIIGRDNTRRVEA